MKISHSGPLISSASTVLDVLPSFLSSIACHISLLSNLSIPGRSDAEIRTLKIVSS